MNRQTQYARIIAFLKKHREATTHDLIRVSGSVCPWKRMAESGYKFGSQWKTTGRGKYRVYWLA